jgi:hypothetical protein
MPKHNYKWYLVTYSYKLNGCIVQANDLKWTWNESGPTLLGFISPHKNGCPFYKNLNAMIGLTSP